MKHFFFFALLALFGTAQINTALAQSPPDARADSQSDFEFVATVNGTAITQGLLNLNIRAMTNQGQKDSPELRQAVKE